MITDHQSSHDIRAYIQMICFLTATPTHQNSLVGSILWSYCRASCRCLYSRCCRRCSCVRCGVWRASGKALPMTIPCMDMCYVYSFRAHTCCSHTTAFWIFFFSFSVCSWRDQYLAAYGETKPPELVCVFLCSVLSSSFVITLSGKKHTLNVAIQKCVNFHYAAYCFSFHSRLFLNHFVISAVLRELILLCLCLHTFAGCCVRDLLFT